MLIILFNSKSYTRKRITMIYFIFKSVDFSIQILSCLKAILKQTKNKQTPWPSVRKRTIPTDRTPLDESQSQLLRIEVCRVVSAADPLRSLISVF
jgi:hypothetical protein